MSLRDRFKRGGGGFLNNVAGIITGVGFTTEPGWANTANRLYFRVDIQQDGAEAPVTTHLDAGFAENITISEDALSITEDVDGALWKGTAFTRFYNSLCDNAGESGFEDVEGEVIDMSSLVGVRAQFVQVKDEEKMARDAKRFKASKGAVNETGQRKGKDGKYYDQRTLEVSTVYSIGNDAGTPAKSTKPAAKSVKAAPAASKKVTAKVSDGPSIEEFAKDVVIDVLTEAKGKLMKTSLSTGIIKHFNQGSLKGDSRREDVRKIAVTDDFIETMVTDGLITFEKNQLALA
jgi:hypothetical protein